MNYNNLITTARESLSEFNTFYEYELSKGSLDFDSGPHIVFALCLCRFLKRQ